MTVTVELPDSLAERLAVEAVRRGLTVADLAVEALEGFYGTTPPTRTTSALDAFIGCGSSGQTEPFDIHRARADLAARKLAEGA